jgi:hypothetical protein
MEALGKLKQEDWEFKTVWATLQDPVLQTQKMKANQKTSKIFKMCKIQLKY